MDHVGIDVHKKESQICVLTEEGVVEEVRIRTERERFGAVLGGRTRARVLLEAATESEWVAQCLEGLGHEVIVADPNYAPMYGQRTRRVKTDKRDARALAEACRLGAYRRAHRTSAAQRAVRDLLNVRDGLIESRSRLICVVRAQVRQRGWRIRSGDATTFVARVRELAMQGEAVAVVEPVLLVLESIETQVRHCDEQLEHVSEADERVRRLRSVPSVGPVTAAAMVAAIDEPKRFHGAHQVEAYFGLVPSERSSGEKQRRGGITKTGSPQIRGLLVQVALSMMRVKKAQTTALWTWADRIAQRRGTRVAAVALARRLAGMLWAMLRDGTHFDPSKLERRGRLELLPAKA